LAPWHPNRPPTALILCDSPIPCPLVNSAYPAGSGVEGRSARGAAPPLRSRLLAAHPRCDPPPRRRSPGECGSVTVLRKSAGPRRRPQGDGGSAIAFMWRVGPLPAIFPWLTPGIIRNTVQFYKNQGKTLEHVLNHKLNGGRHPLFAETLAGAALIPLDDGGRFRWLCGFSRSRSTDSGLPA
jgi:hypothetical protein